MDDNKEIDKVQQLADKYKVDIEYLNELYENISKIKHFKSMIVQHIEGDTQNKNLANIDKRKVIVKELKGINHDIENLNINLNYFKF